MNHPCLLNFAERIMLYFLMDQMLYKLPTADKANVIQMLEAAVVPVGHSGWYAAVVTTPEFDATYMHGARNYGGNVLRPLYETPLAEGFHFRRNFLSHTAFWVSNLLPL